MEVRVVNKSKYKIPEYKTSGSSGVDLIANVDSTIVLNPMDRSLVPTGLFIEVPQGYEAQIRARSGLAINNGISLANGVGTIDSDYRGEVKVILINLSNDVFSINPGDRIAQLILIKYEKIDFQIVEDLDETNRGTGGFGHTGQ